jgi:hypothetical protein
MCLPDPNSFFIYFFVAAKRYVHFISFIWVIALLLKEFNDLIMFVTIITLSFIHKFNVSYSCNRSQRLFAATVHNYLEFYRHFTEEQNKFYLRHKKANTEKQADFI